MFREIVGKREISQKISPGTTLGDILGILARKYGKDFQETINEKTGQVNIDTLIMLNGKNVRNINTKINDDDLIIITAPLGGG
jgi:MoaD family protein